MRINREVVEINDQKNLWVIGERDIEELKMGLIKAAVGAIGSTLHDQWKEAIRCEDMGNVRCVICCPVLL